MFECAQIESPTGRPHVTLRACVPHMIMCYLWTVDGLCGSGGLTCSQTHTPEASRAHTRFVIAIPQNTKYANVMQIRSRIRRAHSMNIHLWNMNNFIPPGDESSASWLDRLETDPMAPYIHRLSLAVFEAAGHAALTWHAERKAYWCTSRPSLQVAAAARARAHPHQRYTR
jgi:hypothetical protein